MHVLIVDDDELVRTAAALALRQAGHEVTGVSNGQAALERVEAADVVLLDVLMPDMPGLAVLSQLRERGIQTPVVIMSASPAFSENRMLTSMGAAAVIAKPFDSAEMVRTVEAAAD